MGQGLVRKLASLNFNLRSLSARKLSSWKPFHSQEAFIPILSEPKAFVSILSKPRSFDLSEHGSPQELSASGYIYIHTHTYIYICMYTHIYIGL